MNLFFHTSEKPWRQMTLRRLPGFFFLRRFHRDMCHKLIVWRTWTPSQWLMQEVWMIAYNVHGSIRVWYGGVYIFKPAALSGVSPCNCPSFIVPKKREVFFWIINLVNRDSQESHLKYLYLNQFKENYLASFRESNAWCQVQLIHWATCQR